MNRKISYIICSTPRSGSTLLCDLLTATKVAGRPQSYFMTQFYSDWARYLNVSMENWNSDNEFDQCYLNAVLMEGVGDSQVFGLRMQRESLEDLNTRLCQFYPDKQSDKTRFSAAFGTTHYIHISRKDKIAQAVSLLRAEQSGLWHIHTDRTERERLKLGHAPHYNAKALSKLVTKLEKQDASWLDWFSQQSIQPIPITYERLSADPKNTLANTLSALGLEPSIAEMVEPRTAKMSSNESSEWIERFRLE